MKDIVVIGSGGFSKQVIELIEELNEIKQEYNLLGIIDDNESLIGSNVLGYEVIGNTSYIHRRSQEQKLYGVIAIADGDIRKKVANTLTNIKWVNLIHPKAIMSKYSNLGIGNIICAGTIVNPDSCFGDHCHINVGCTLGHDVNLKNHVTIMPGSRISGNVKIKNSSMIGTGATIIQGLVIEENVTLGAGSVVVKNTVPDSLYIGVPAKRHMK